MRVIVSGMVAADPHQGGATWAVLQYVLGFREMGHEVLLVEPVSEDRFDDSAVRAYFAGVTGAFGLEGSAAMVCGHRTVGLPYRALRDVARTSDVIFNISGMLAGPELFEPVPVRVYVDLDPAFVQLWHTEGIDMRFEGHTHFVTVGLAVGSARCRVPTCGRAWTTTLPPVVLRHWPQAPALRAGVEAAVTTVGNWRGYGSVVHEGRFHGQKAHSFRLLMQLPELCEGRFAPALAIHPAEDADLRALNDHGWDLRDPVAEAGTPGAYRRFLQSSLAEIGVAKSGYVVSGSGWFSDRSAAYLASGRPVVAQDTGFSRFLPTGAGLLAFDDVEGAAAAVGAVRDDYPEHSRAARAFAEEHLDARHVLGRLLEEVGC